MGGKKDKIVGLFTKAMHRNFSPCTVIWFGSRAKGKAHKDSDYDFIVVSPRFQRWEWEERSAKAYHLKRNIPAAMDIICLTPEEFEQKKKGMGVIQQAVKEGVEIKL